MNKKFIITFFSLFIIPFFAMADYSNTCFTASGFGSASANGTYQFDNASSSNASGVSIARYKNENSYYFYVNPCSDSLLIFSDFTSCPTTGYYKNAAGGGGTATYLDYEGSYSVDTGTAPGGTVSLVSCPGGGGSSTLDIAPLNNRTSTAIVAANVTSEIISFPLYILETYGHSIVIMAIIFALVGVIYGVIKLVRL